MFHSIENRSHQCLPWINLRMRIENFPIDYVFDGHRLGLISSTYHDFKSRWIFDSTHSNIKLTMAKDGFRRWKIKTYSFQALPLPFIDGDTVG